MFKCHTNVCYDEYPEWAKRHKKFVLHNFILNKLAEISVWATHTNTNSEHPYDERVSRRECRECTNKNKFHPMRIGIRSRIHSNPGAKCELVNGFSLAIFFSSPLSLSLFRSFFGLVVCSRRSLFPMFHWFTGVCFWRKIVRVCRLVLVYDTWFVVMCWLPPSMTINNNKIY